MVSYVIRRLFQAILVMLVVAFVSFSMFTYAGDPVNNMVGQEASRADREALRERLGLNDPFMVQFGRFVGRAVQGEFGISYQMQRPVEDLISERMPATLELVFVSAVLALATGIPLGVYCGIHRHSWVSRALLTVSLIGVSLPTFVIGIFLIYLFAVHLGWLSSFGRGQTVQLGWWSTGFLTPSGLLALIMPSITLSLFQTTLIMRLVRPRCWRSCAPTTSSSPAPAA